MLNARSCVALCVLATACAGSLESRTRTAIDAFGAIVEAESNRSFAQCDREKTALAEAGKPAELEKATERCARVVDGFDRIAVLQDAAATALERGEVEKAQAMIAQARSLWASMRGAP